MIIDTTPHVGAKHNTVVDKLEIRTTSAMQGMVWGEPELSIVQPFVQETRQPVGPSSAVV